MKLIKRAIRTTTLLAMLVTFTCLTVLNPFMWVVAVGEWAFDEKDGFASCCFNELARMYHEVLKRGV